MSPQRIRAIAREPMDALPVRSGETRPTGVSGLPLQNPGISCIG
jgi:hypothetical protein